MLCTAQTVKLVARSLFGSQSSAAGTRACSWLTFVLRRRHAFSSANSEIGATFKPLWSAATLSQRCFQPWQRSSLLQRSQTSAFSSQPNKQRVKYLMTATYISAVIGACLLTAVGMRMYGRFKKRARGIEEVDEPLYGRRKKVLCRYRGYALHASLVDTIVNEVPWFDVRSDDVWVVSFPKAGTTWVQEIVYLISTDFDMERAKAENIETRFPYLEFPFPGIKTVAAMPSPRFIKTHLPFSLLPKNMAEKKPKVIYVARNPKDTAVSLRAFIKLIGFEVIHGTVEDFAQVFVDGNVIYGPWWKHVAEGWEHRNDDNVLFITYEDLQKDFRGTVKDIGRFLGKILTDSQIAILEQHCSFDSMLKNDSINYTWNKGFWKWKEGHFFRKGVVGDWKNHLSAEMAEKFDAMTAKLESIGLQFTDTPQDQG